ncbi:RICIN domain-containing protein [Streptomyces griseoincarnatus]
MPVSTVPATRPPRQVVRIPRPGGITAFPTASPDGRPWTPEPPYRRIENRHRGKGLGVDGMSTADSTQVVQSTDNGTEDHEWRFV